MKGLRIGSGCTPDYFSRLAPNVYFKMSLMSILSAVLFGTDFPNFICSSLSVTFVYCSTNAAIFLLFEFIFKF